MSITFARSVRLFAASIVMCVFAAPAVAAGSSGDRTTPAPAAASALVSPDTSLSGPFRVGVRTVAISGGRTAEVWYPAASGPAATESYDVRDFLPPAIKALLTADLPAVVTYDAARDAAVADGEFPVVLFSHGFTGLRLQSTFLTAHLASWGMIVASPDHASRDMYHVLEGTASGDRQAAVGDLGATLDMLIAASDTPGDAFAGHIDAERVATVGHSAGGFTALAMAADPRIKGFVSMASGRAKEQASPQRPSLFIAGSNDLVVEPAVSKSAFESAATPTALIELAGVGHNGFDDYCTIGGGRGLIGLAEASGLGPLLDARPELRSLGTDGCGQPNVDPQVSEPLINGIVTQWLRWLFGAESSSLPPNLPSDVATVSVRP